ncbi:Gfo/Idh/MocA family protein [Neorhodopirellula lusitana]|uniref:Gfo/Idh/MocA family protein n=1 Tax=Neorhodopirellula lusitana TaxID=445327 RepID=UPI00384AB0DF
MSPAPPNHRDTKPRRPLAAFMRSNGDEKAANSPNNPAPAAPTQGPGPTQSVENRRGFFAKSSLAIAGGTVLAAEQAVAMVPHVGGSDCLKVALIGCGARGRSAAAEVLMANSDQLASSSPPSADRHGSVRLVAMADAFGSQLQSAYRSLHSRFGQSIDIGDRRFVGIDAWRHALACDADLIILATPPVFRPKQFEAAVAAGKHVMMESPVAVDHAGLQRITQAALIAKTGGLAVCAGLQRRHDQRLQETIAQLRGETSHDGTAPGMIGKLVSASINARALPSQPLRPSQPVHPGQPSRPNQTSRADLTSRPDSRMSDHEYELRNWLSFQWAGGGDLDQRFIHSLDLVHWCLGTAPLSASIATREAGPQCNFTREHEISRDHQDSCDYQVTYNYPGDFTASLQSFAQPSPPDQSGRKQSSDNLTQRIGETIHGTEGSCDLDRAMIRDQSGKVIWRSDAKRVAGQRWQTQANRLVNAIRTGEVFDESPLAIASTSAWLMGRACTTT